MRKEIRNRILARDGHQCVKCGATENLEIDHIIPVSKGGMADEINLQVLCGRCNRKKKNKLEWFAFFIIDQHPDYMLFSKDFPFKSVSSKDFAKMTELAFEAHRQFWVAKGHIYED